MFVVLVSTRDFLLYCNFYNPFDIKVMHSKILPNWKCKNISKISQSVKNKSSHHVDNVNKYGGQKCDICSWNVEVQSGVFTSLCHFFTVKLINGNFNLLVFHLFADFFILSFAFILSNSICSSFLICSALKFLNRSFGWLVVALCLLAIFRVIVFFTDSQFYCG